LHIRLYFQGKKHNAGYNTGYISIRCRNQKCPGTCLQGLQSHTLVFGHFWEMYEADPSTTPTKFYSGNTTPVIFPMYTTRYISDVICSIPLVQLYMNSSTPVLQSVSLCLLLCLTSDHTSTWYKYSYQLLPVIVHRYIVNSTWSSNTSEAVPVCSVSYEYRLTGMF
jgi:hypothetical protein